MRKDKAKVLAYLEGWLSLITNIILFVFKFIIGHAIGSVALIADAWHTLSDSISSIVLLIGIKLSNKPADKEHPFGHGRAEIIASMIIGFMLIVIAINFVIESVNKLNNHESVEYTLWAIIITIITILCKEGLAQYAFWASRRTGLSSLKADGWHHRTDSLSSIIILAGIFINPYFWWMDGVLGIIVALFILFAAYHVLKDSINNLLGKDVSIDQIKAIKKICKDVCRMEVYPHHIHLHNYGNHSELTLHIKLPKNMSLNDAHILATNIENKIKTDLDIISTIHMEPLN